MITWLEGTDSTSRVVVGEPSEGGFTRQELGAALGGQAVQSDVALGADGAAMIAYKEQYGDGNARVFLAEREPGGAWKDAASDGESFSFLPTAYEPRVRFFPDGERLLVWNQWMSTGYGVAVARKPPSSDWQLPANADDVLSQHFFFSNGPTPAVNARGDAVISWYQSDGGALLAWESERFGHDGAFSHPAKEDYLSIRSTPIDSHPIANPRPALSPSGDAAIVWTQENGKGSVLVYLATRGPAGPWSKPQSLDDALSPRLGIARCALGAFSPSGDLFVVWYQDTGDGDRVYAAHRAPDGTWVEPGREPTLVSSPGVEALLPALAIGDGGSVLVAWAERHEDGWAVAARRRGQAGTAWGPVEIVGKAEKGTVSGPSVAVGGAREFGIVAWTQGEGKTHRAVLRTVP
jgi:hypothetical protein